MREKMMRSLRALQQLGYVWIARDASDQLYAYTERPFSYPYGWDVSDGAFCLISQKEFELLPAWITDQPAEIERLLKELLQ